MPSFSNPFYGNNLNKKLTKEELIRTIRFSIAAEFEAIQLYEQIIESTDDNQVKKLLKEISDDEKIHVGNFNLLLENLSPKEKEFYNEGKTEASEIIQEK